MPRREHFINKLRELGYTYRGETQNTQKWRKGSHHVYLPKNAVLADAWVKSTLRQCNETEEEIDTFIRLCNS